MRTCWLNNMLPDGDDDQDIPSFILFCRSGTLLDRSVSGVSHMPTTATLTVGLACVCQREPVWLWLTLVPLPFCLLLTQTKFSDWHFVALVFLQMCDWQQQSPCCALFPVGKERKKKHSSCSWFDRLVRLCEWVCVCVCVKAFAGGSVMCMFP